VIPLQLISKRSARSAVATAAALCLVLTGVSGHAQTLPSETDGNPNEVLVFEQMRVPRWLAETVVRAAQVTGVDPAYLMALADKESSLLPDNKARTSSAEGLFQFVEGTWLDVLRRYGPKHGYAPINAPPSSKLQQRQPLTATWQDLEPQRSGVRLRDRSFGARVPSRRHWHKGWRSTAGLRP